MRYIWMIFTGLLVAMLAILPRLGHRRPPSPVNSLPTHRVAYSPADLAKADSIVAFGLAQRGTPYVWAGTSPLTGFDCSGFIVYTFAHFGVPIPHSTALLINVGRPVARTEAQPGDIIVFTGTDKASSTPGHAGIVISGRGALPVHFVHASSSRREPFVKVSQVENSDYERRFMQVRRVLGMDAGFISTTKAKIPGALSAATGRATGPVAALPVRAVAVQVKAAPAVPLPKALPKRALRFHAAAVPKPGTTHKTMTKAGKARRTITKADAEQPPKYAIKPRPSGIKIISSKKKGIIRR